MKKITENSGSIKEKALSLITLHIGDVTAQMYAKFYKNKTDKFVLKSLEELMTNLMGKEKAKLEIKKVFN